MRIKNLVIGIAMVLAATPAFAQVRSIQVFSGGSNWHGLYSGATVSTTGSGTSVTAK